MKGLFIKDLYMARRYCRSYFVIALLFLAVSLAGNGNVFFVYYPCLLGSMIPVTLLGYDERSGFLEYSTALPYTKAEIVSEKYLFGLCAQLLVLLVTGIAQGVKMRLDGSFEPLPFTVLMLSALMVAAVSSSISLPFIFKYGAEKGRIAYYVMIGFICAASVLFSALFQGDIPAEISSGVLFAVLTAVCVGVYALSWYLSVVFFRKREL